MGPERPLRLAGTDLFLEGDRDRTSRWCVVRKRPLTIRREKTKDEEARTDEFAHGFIPARKGTFLFGEKYSLDRGL